MARLVVTEFISLDGVVQSPGGEDFTHRDWAFAFDRGEDGEQFKVDEALAAEALLLGRKTYEVFAGTWPGRDGPLADKYNAMPKYVVSRTLTEPTWSNSSVLSGSMVSEVTKLKDELTGELQVAGSIELVGELLRTDLVDEIRLMTFPVILGVGRRLFQATPDKTTWRLQTLRSVGEGVPISVYERVRD